MPFDLEAEAESPALLNSGSPAILNLAGRSEEASGTRQHLTWNHEGDLALYPYAPAGLFASPALPTASAADRLAGEGVRMSRCIFQDTLS